MNSPFRPPPPQGAPPSYAFVTRVYKRSLRPVVIAIGTLTALWSLLWGVGSFRVGAAGKIDSIPIFQTIAYVLGALYMTVFVIEVLGVVAAASRRVPLIRLYAFLSILGGLIAVTAELIRIIVHFGHKNDLIKECTSSSTGDTVVFRYGFWGPLYNDTLDPAEANEWCKRAWTRGAWSEIVSLLFEMFLSILFTSIAFSYYRQSLDPASPANAGRAPSSRVRAGAWGPPDHYNPAYNSSVPNLSYNSPYASGQYAPPPGPPPHPPKMEPDDTDLKPPSYGFSSGGGNLRSLDDDNKDDPFADFDGPRRLEQGGERNGK